MSNWEERFIAWSKGPSDTEKQRAENAEKMIREAITSSEKLKNRDIKIFTQGSYRNRVNVRKESDVDVGVVCYDSFFDEYPDDNVKNSIIESKEIKPATYLYATFKDEVEEALVLKFGRVSVSRGNKSFDIKENSYKVESDVAVFFEHRRYDKYHNYKSGVEMLTDNRNPLSIKNWPEQHYENGVSKNSLTNRRYKRVVRILKSLCYKMKNDGIDSAKKTPGFLLECMASNVSNDLFNVDNTFTSEIRSILVTLYEKTKNEENCKKMVEVSSLKWLFRPSQPWERKNTNQFIVDAYHYIGYK